MPALYRVESIGLCGKSTYSSNEGLMSIKPLNANTQIAVIGLGYVGLPLAHAFAEHYSTVAYDIDSRRVTEILDGTDSNMALSAEQLASRDKIHYTNDADQLSNCDVYIITAPTPVNEHKQPDMKPLKDATALAATFLQAGDMVIFESTVYPGATEEECIPILSQISGLTLNSEFYVGYSPERINPGDSGHCLSDTIKVTSGSCEEAAERTDHLYRSIISAGTHRVSSIKVAEAAKVIENTQRDLNIALVNELAILFDKLDIDTQEVLKAAGSKWNFLPFSPGLVGGHCIGVDPYYLTYKAQQVGYHPEVILAGRRINDSMGIYVADSVVRLMLSRRIQIIDSRILILGLAFKENCPDIRNTRVNDIISTLNSYSAEIEVYDPWVDPGASEHLIEAPQADNYDAIIIAVAHQQFADIGISAIREFGKANSIIYDVKHLFPAEEVDGSL